MAAKHNPSLAGNRRREPGKLKQSYFAVAEGSNSDKTNAFLSLEGNASSTGKKFS